MGAGRPYAVRIGEGVLGELAALLEGRRARLVADRRVLEALRPRLPAALAESAVALPAGEAAKAWPVLGEVLEDLADPDPARRLDRGDLVVALGGGAALDLAGLAAALYLRGVDWVACPTTLLAMVDASVGGKTAVDLARGKNLAGAFHPPVRVLADLSALGELPALEWQSGLGEVLKTALVGAPELLEDLAERGGRREPQAWAGMVARCVAVKAEVVAADEREAGPREVLNLGHTFAHGIETTAGHGRVPHGLAVAVGVHLAVELSRETGLLEEPELPERVRAASRGAGLPVGLGELEARFGVELPAERVLAAMGRDKKARAGRARYVLLRGAGRPAPGRSVEDGPVAALLARR